MKLLRVLAVPAALTLVAACGGGRTPGTPQGTAASASAPAAKGAHPVSQTTARPPAMAGVTARGALVLLSSSTGTPVRTLVPNGVIGDEISVSADGQTIFFSRRHGCVDDVESVAVSGGKPTLLTTGSVPSLSPDGSTLAFARQPTLTRHCMKPAGSDLSAQYSLVTRTLGSGVERVYPMLPAGQPGGLPAPISHLSWAPNGTELAVSIAAIQDNEGWQIMLVDTATAQNYLGGTGDTQVPVTGPDRRRSYWREGVYLPGGNLFASRGCCAGEPARNVSKLMWEITPGGVFKHRVAIGFAGLDHTSLAVNQSGKWLLYLAGTGLYVSEKGARPRQVGSGLIAAAWL
ncbi:MAG: TolB family protein [Streptosporangiaceae bacterium]